jgi:hypothetical protein
LELSKEGTDNLLLNQETTHPKSKSIYNKPPYSLLRTAEADLRVKKTGTEEKETSYARQGRCSTHGPKIDGFKGYDKHKQQKGPADNARACP